MCCIPGTICFEWMKGMPAAVIAVAGVVITATIAYRQYAVAKAKLKLDLFDKRYAIFQEIWEILSGVALLGTLEFKKRNGLYTPFNNLRPKARFLFDAAIADYVDELATHWTKLSAVEPYERPKEAEEKARLQNWFHEQATSMRERFGPYLNFEKWK